MSEGQAASRLYATQPAGNIPSLTGIRGVAAAWVVIYHVSLSFAGSMLHSDALRENPIIASGWIGVDLFFVLSGYILMQAHGRDFTKVTAPQVWRFAKLRFFRVYPLSWSVLLLILAACVIDGRYYSALLQGSVDGSPRLAFVRTFLLGTEWMPGRGDFNQPIWSLSAEIVGYAAFPWVAAILLRIRSYPSLLGIAVGCAATLIAVEVSRQTLAAIDLSISGALSRMAFCFVAGAAFAAARRITPIGVARQISPLSVAAVVLIAVLLVTSQAAGWLPILFGVLIYSLSFRTGPVDWLLATKPMASLGRISFSLYLVHLPVMILFELHLAGANLSPAVGALVLAAFFGLIVAISGLLYVTVERPVHAFARSVAKRQS